MANFTWNHRIVREADGETLVLVECSYDNKGRPDGYAQPCLMAESIEEFRTILGWMNEALDKPIIDITDFD